MSDTRLTVVEHPLVQHKLSYLRDKDTPTVHFRKLAEALLDGGLGLITGGTDTHLMLVDLRESEWTGKAAEERLHEIDVTVNRNTVPFDERSPFVTSGIRLGTPAMTMRGFDEDDFRAVGANICEALTDAPDIDNLRGRVAALLAQHPLYPGFRGYTTYVA